MGKKYLLVLSLILIFLNIPIVYCEEVTLLFAPENLTGTQHEEMNEVLLISVDLEVNNIEDLFRWEFEFDYDENILELWEGKLGAEVYGETGGWSGNINEGMFASSFSGSGLLWTYYLRPKALGSSTFRINSKLYDSSDNLIPHETPSCEIDIISFENWLELEKQTTIKRIEELSQTFESLNNDFQSLSSSYDSLETVNEDLDSQLEKVQSDYSELEEKFNSLSEEYESLSVYVEQLLDQIEELKNRGIPGFPITSMIIGLILMIIMQITLKKKKGIPPVLNIILTLIFISQSIANPVFASLNTDIISWWPADGHVLDIAGENHGNPYNPMTYAQGKVGLAFSFTGEGNYIALSGHNFDTINGLTIEGWVMHNSIPQRIQRYLTLGNSEGAFAVLRCDRGQLHFYILRDGKLDFDHITSTGVLKVGKWHHVVGTFDRDYMRLFADGKEVENKKVVGNLYLGTNHQATFSSPDEPMDGLLDEFTLYSRVLTYTEIKDIYNAGLQGDSGRPTLYFEPESVYGTHFEGDNELILIKTHLMISNVEDLFRWEFEFDYDENILELWEGKLGAEVYGETGGWSGNINEGMFASSFSGSGLLWTYYLRPKALGSSTFRINSKLYDSSDNLVIHKMAEGIITTKPPEELVGIEQADLYNTLEEIGESYQSLNEEHLQLSSLINSVQAINEDLKSQLEKVQSDYSELEEEFNSLSEEYASVSVHVEQLLDQIEELKNRGIPGFPIESIIIGLICLIILFTSAQYNRKIANVYL